MPSQPTNQRRYDSSSETALASEKQLKKLAVEAGKRGLSDRWQKALVHYLYKKESRKQLTKKEASELIEMMIKTPDAELNETLEAIKIHYKAVSESPRKVYDVDPETGEVKNSGPITEAEIDKALGL